MEHTGTLPWQRQKEPSPQEVAQQELEASLRDTQVRIAQAYAGFNSAVDADLVDSFVYEIMALRSRYSYLLRQRKALDGAEVEGAALAAVRPSA